MNISRRNFLGAGASVAAVPVLAKTISGAKPPEDDNRFRVMFIGAHPDDVDISSSGTASMFIEKGARVKFVSVTNGNAGHHIMSRHSLAARRRLEATKAAATVGAESYEILNFNDTELEATLETRREVTRLIRSFAPHFVFIHRDCDYHADHRAAAIAVKDCAYLLEVPHWCPDAPVPKASPVIWLTRDQFTVPREIRPDIMVDVEKYRSKMCDTIACHESQIFEWLPYINKNAHELPKDMNDPVARKAYIDNEWLKRKRIDAKRFAKQWTARFPGKDVPELMEVFELSEYGRKPTKEELNWFKQ